MPQPNRKTRLVAFFLAMAVVIATPLAVIASDVFTDVSDDNVFHDDISWLADANVTRGCNPPANTEFCPGDNVTREQMSAFMRRLAQYLDAEDGTPAEADNAGSLNGEPASSYQTVVMSTSCGVSASGTPPMATTTCLPSTGGTIGDAIFFEAFELSIEVPAAGSLQLSSMSLSDNTIAWAFLLDENCPGNATALLNGAVNGHIWGATSGSSTAATLIVGVDAGNHTIRLCGNNGSGAPVQLNTASLDAVWTAGGSVSLAGSTESPVDVPGLLGG